LNCCCYYYYYYYYYYHHPTPPHHYYYYFIILLNSSLAGSQMSMGLTDQALLINCPAKNFLTIQYVLSITAFCITIYKAGWRLSSFKLACKPLGITPVVDSTNGII
jgi:hypothetical protein